MWCNDRGPLVGITFTWGAGFLIQRKKMELHGFLELNFRFIDSDVLFDLFFLSFHDLKELRIIK